MSTLFHLDSSPLETSISRELAREFVKTWKAIHNNGKVIYRDLAVAAPKPLDAAWIAASYTPADARTARQNEILAHSDELISELENADEYVIGVAMHNFTVPASLRLWIDQIARKGKTFDYGPEGTKGLLTGKKATILVACGGVYEPGSRTEAFNFVEPYLKAVLGYLGVTDVTFVTASGSARVMFGAIDRETFLKPTLEKVRELVA